MGICVPYPLFPQVMAENQSRVSEPTRCPPIGFPQGREQGTGRQSRFTVLEPSRREWPGAYFHPLTHSTLGFSEPRF